MITMMSKEEIEMEMRDNEGMYTIIDDVDFLDESVIGDNTYLDDETERIIQELILNYDEFK